MTNNSIQKNIFDYRTLRLVIGLIACLLPIVVSFFSSQTLTSISASYYTEGRDWFVGLLFIVGSFLLAYNGHTRKQLVASKIAAFAAVGIAIFPTACEKCEAGFISTLHYISAAILFSILAYFCLVPFRKKVKAKNSSKQSRRNTIYLLCGIVMIICMLGMAIANFALPAEFVARLRLIYWGEAIGLGAFGVAWFVSGKALPFFADPNERLKLEKALDPR